MGKIVRLLPVFVCFLLTVSIAASPSIAYAAADTQAPPAVEGEVEEGEEGAEESGEEIPANTGMFDSTFLLGKALMGGIWSMFQIYVPGFSFTFGQLWYGLFSVSLSLLVMRLIFGFGGSGSKGDAPRTSSTDNPKISEERRRDEF